MTLSVLSDEHFMKQALVEAQKAFDQDEVPVGAIVVHKNRIIARAHNYTEHLTDVTAHAEMQAITAASNFIGSKYLVDCEIYVTLEPCLMCAGAIFWARPKRLIFGAFDAKRGFTLLSDNLLHVKTEMKSGVLSDDCGKILTQFFQNKRTKI
jgi:tRNA(adenine34) deaminase